MDSKQKHDVKPEDLQAYFQSGRLGTLDIKLKDNKVKLVKVNLEEVYKQATGSTNQEVEPPRNVEAICVYDLPGKKDTIYALQLAVIIKQGAVQELSVYPKSRIESDGFKIKEVVYQTPIETIQGNKYLGTYKKGGATLNVKFIPAQNLTEHETEQAVPIIGVQRYAELADKLNLKPSDKKVLWTENLEGKLTGKLD